MSGRLVALPVDDPRCGQLSLRLRAALWLICGVAGPGGVVAILGKDHLAGLGRLLGASDREGRDLALDVGALVELGELRLEVGALVVRALAAGTPAPPAAPPAQGELKLTPPPGKASPPAAPARSRRKSASALPDGWGPDATAYGVGGARGLTREVVDAEAERFRDHALSKGRACIDWHAAFRNWLRGVDLPPEAIEKGEPSTSAATGRTPPAGGDGPAPEVAALLLGQAGAGDPRAAALEALGSIGAAAPTTPAGGDPWKGVKLAGAAPAPTLMVAGQLVGPGSAR